ncbi:MAG: MFS transporter [Alcanivoracaceae bacterium]|nr:MFS transporter [Alcanivoracaceae bacterium]
MLPLIAPLFALLAGVALLLLGSGLLNTVLVLRGSAEGYSDGMLGFIMSGYFVGYFVGTHMALSVITRVGHIRAFAICAAVAASSVLLHVVFVDPWFWMLLRVITGAALVMLYTVIESWLNGQTTAAHRGQVFAVYMVVNLIALALAQQMLRLDEPTSFLLFAVASILVTLSLVPVAWTRFAQPVIHEVRQMRFAELRSIAPVAVAGALSSGLAMGAFWGLAPLYAGHIGLYSDHIATFMSCAIIGGALFQYPLGRFSDTHDRRRVLRVIALTATLAALLLIVTSNAGLLVLVAMFVYGGLAFAVYPVAVAHLIDQLEAQDILAGGTALLLVHGIGAAIGPALAGQLMSWWGAQALPLYFALAQGLLALFVWRHERVSGAVEVAPQPSPFVPMLRTTPTALEMLPEEEVEPSADDAQDEQRPSQG